MQKNRQWLSTCWGKLQTAAVLAAVLSVAQSGVVYAQKAADNGASEEETAEPEQERRTIDLGVFDIKDLRPTRNETTKLRFSMYLALEPSVDEHTAEQLNYWKHRLRNQVIIALRAADPNDFLEPGLDRFRRSIKLRVNRALKAALVSEALLTEFTFALE